MALTKITGKDFKEAVDWLLKEKQGCVHQVLGRTDEGTELCLVIGWADIGYDLEEVKKNGYEDEGYYICSKIGYQHRNNGMQSDFEMDFPMPYNPETGDVWDTDTYVAKGDEQSWQTDADMYNKEAEKIWATWGVPNEDGQTTLDIMESKKCSRKCGSKKSEEKKHTCSMQKKKESLNKKAESANSDYYFSIWSANHPENEKGPTRFICVKEPASSKGWYDVSKEYDDAYEEEMELRNGNVDYTYIAKKVMDKIVSGAIKSCDDPYDAIPNFSRRFKEYPFNLNAYKQDFLDGKYGSRSESKKHTCSMQKKKESLAAKKSKKCEGLMDDLPYDAPVAIESLCAEIMSHTEEFTVEDAAVAEMCGKWYIRDYADGSTAAQNEDEFVDEVLAGLSGSPLDGSPFGAAEAEEYARKIYNEVVA